MCMKEYVMRFYDIIVKTVGFMRLSFLTICFYALPIISQTDIESSFFRDVYHNGNLVHYLEGLNDYVVYEGLHSGCWSDADQLIMSVNGNPYYMNKYYVDNFRVDSRFLTGSTLYVPNMNHYNLHIGTHDATLRFNADSLNAEYVETSTNVGNIGGITKGTEKIIHIFHRAGWEGAYKPNVSIPYRQHINGAGTMDMAINSKSKNGSLSRFHLYATYGNRSLPKYDADGLVDDSPLFGSNYFRMQADGGVHINKKAWIDKFSYIFNAYTKGDYGSEFYYNWEEQSRITSVSGSAIGIRNRNNEKLTIGVTYAMTHIKHKNIAFSRNVVDQDGESFEPWYPDGNWHEMSMSVNYSKRINRSLSFEAQMYDSYMGFSTGSKYFQNEVFYKLPDPLQQHFGMDDHFFPIKHTKQPLYRYEWTSRSFGSMLLENFVGVKADKPVAKWLRLDANAGITLDGMLLGKEKSKLSPNIKADVTLCFRPTYWLEASLKLAHDRISYTLNHIRFFSNDYLNGNIYYSGTNTLIATTGGRSHKMRNGLKQMGMVSLEIPIILRLGKNKCHEIMLYQTYRKYHNVWMTRFASGINENGFMDSNGMFYYLPGNKEYIIDYQPSGMMGKSFFNNTPYYLSQTTRYTYHNKKICVSLSWQSMILGCVSALGNGPASNNVGVLSESTANPNTLRVVLNPNSPSAAIGRADQDKGYVCRIFFSYNVNKNLQLGFLAKWTDGQPFTTFNTCYKSVGENSQVAIIPERSRGTNPIDHNFGSRENAIFNVDVHARYVWRMWHHSMSLTFQSYNVIDFGNSINEYCFNTGLNDGRADMALNIPRGLLITYNVKL